MLGRVGSLNVATAGAIAMYEVRRRAWTLSGSVEPPSMSLTRPKDGRSTSLRPRVTPGAGRPPPAPGRPGGAWRPGRRTAPHASAARSSQRPSAGTEHLDAGRSAERVHEGRRGRAGHRGQRRERREAQGLTASELRGREPARVGEQRGLRGPRGAAGGSAPGAARRRPVSDQPGRSHQEGERLLGGPVARGQQLLVEVEEGHDVGRRHLVEHSLGADVDRRVGQRRARPSPPSPPPRPRPSGLQLLAQPRHARAQRLEASRPAVTGRPPAARHRSAGSAAPARSVGRPRRRTPRSGPSCRRPRRPAAGPARAVQHAHDAGAAPERGATAPTTGARPSSRVPPGCGRRPRGRASRRARRPARP